MFKHLTRTLKLGLTTLTILTAGAGAAFAQPAGFATAIDPIADCSSGGFRKPSYCTIQVVNCIDNPFGTLTRDYGTGGCATTLGTKAHTVAKVRYCGEASHRAEPACASTVAGANAAHWAKQNPDAPDSPDTVRPRNQFLKGTADGVDTAGVVVRERGALYFDTATFNGRALGGDATDGVAFFWGENGGRFPMYAGIMSGTDLGAPVDNPAGTTASWVGQFQSLWHTTNEDFILEITFGGRADVPGSVGSIEAFIHRQSGSQFYNLTAHFHLKGTFNDNGLIINGTVDGGNFTGNDRDRPTVNRFSGVLTGLIGQEGAVGAFYSDGYYSGGFVARPAHLVVDENGVTAQAFLDTTCSADPFTNKHQNLCYLEYADDRVTRINDCITGGNASDDSQCGTAIAEHSCISNPFASDCADDFTDYYETAQANRIQFCLGDLTNTLCTNSDTVVGICDYAPFAEICFDGDTYKSTRADKINDCHTNTSDPSCTGVTDNPNAVAWEDSFATALADRPAPPTDGTTRGNQFLKDLEDKSAGNLDNGDTVGDIVINHNYTGSLNLSTSTFNGRALGGDAADGVASFGGRVNNQGQSYWYSGIFSGTDLGAPVTQTSGTASWVGRFREVSWRVNTDFVLEIDFNGTGDKAGYIEAFVQYDGATHYYLEGSYDAHGVITGTVDFGSFTNRDRDRSTGTPDGILTGLIGQEGAVGAFISNYTNGGYAGGFVARPPTTVPKRGETYTETKFLNDTCTADPFGYLCYLETDKQRAKIIECTEGGNASTTGCVRAVQLNECLTNPFASNCVTDFADYYVAARAKRNEFCVGDLTNSLCTVPGAKDAICTYAPFASICFDDNEYKDDRETKYPACHADPSVPSCTGVTDRPNAIAWADSFSTALSSAPDTTNRRSQFLKGGASGINRGDIVVPTNLWGSSSLNLNTAEFNGEALGGDAADGVAFIVGRVNDQGTFYYYAGIFSGTDLGAPVTDTSGTASWVGKINAVNVTINKEFVLEIDFNGTGDKSGYIKAFVQQYGANHYYLDGSYDAHGVITGTVDYGTFTNRDRDNPTGTRWAGILTGLIGKDGAVGAFIGNTTGDYAGGFVARPPTDDDLDHLDITCDDDPFHPFCQLVREDQERNDHIIDCIADNGAETNSEFCRRAVIRNPCLANPFTANCATDLSEQYEDAQENRISFCNDPDNKDEPLCGGALITGICEHDPFIAVCFGNGDYNAARIERAKVCAGPNDDGLSCLGVLSRPNVISFLNSFAQEPPLEPNATLENQFLKGGATELNDGDFTGIRAGNLTLADSLEDGTGLGGDAVDGVAFFAVVSNRRYPHYAGILSGTDLGGPLPPTTQKDVMMIWKGRFKAIGSSTYATETDFDLEVTYTGGDEISGRIEAFVQKSGSRHYHLQGDFNNKGVIVGGTVDYARYSDNLRDKIIPRTSNRTGELRGLIGQEGAVGAFIADMPSSSGYFSGGFVARPPE